MHPSRIEAVLRIEEVHFLQIIKSSTVLLAGVSIAFLAFAMLSPVAFASTGTQFAAYQITGSMKGHTFSAMVNESATPASTAGFSSLTLQLGSNDGKSQLFEDHKLYPGNVSILPWHGKSIPELPVS